MGRGKLIRTLGIFHPASCWPPLANDPVTVFRRPRCELVALRFQCQEMSQNPVIRKAGTYLIAGVKLPPRWRDSFGFHGARLAHKPPLRRSIFVGTVFYETPFFGTVKRFNLAPSPESTGYRTGNNMNNWSWKDSPELMARLRSAQNSSANQHIDILTFAGFCESEEQLARHVAFYEARSGE